MAIMCPEVPKEYDLASREGIIFEALSKLPDDYYVFHSVTLVMRKFDKISEHEIDFVVFNQNKGILCLEAKAGQVQYSNGAWRYANGDLMKHDGPFRQASKFCHNLVTYIREQGYSRIANKCKIMSAVCFPSVSRERFKNQALPPEADYNLILFKESLDEIKESIESIFAVPVENAPETTLISNSEKKELIENVLAPQFNLLPIASLEAEHRNGKFKTMLKEQMMLLDYLEEQRTAVINGAAGTGKTLVALEKARRHAVKNEKVLFLCYNQKLKEHLSANYQNDYIDYYTIDGLACKLCHTSIPDYQLLQETLMDYIDDGFPYKHIIIDEGQDFGQKQMEESDIIQLLYDLIADNDDDSTFYIFYDKNQLIQGEKMPDYIENADCRLTLYRNCRNTENIAVSSMRFLGNEKKPKLFERAILGNSPNVCFENKSEEIISAVNYFINKYKETYGDNIVILTAETVEKSILSTCVDNGYYRYGGNKYLVTTCRKFKGLEADVIILVDVSYKHLSETVGRNIIYVGSSRARFELAAVISISEDEICTCLDEFKTRHGKKPSKSLATFFNAKLVEME